MDVKRKYEEKKVWMKRKYEKNQKRWNRKKSRRNEFQIGNSI